MAESTNQGMVVFVPKRQDFSGYWSAGEHWPAGPTPVEVVADEEAKTKAKLQARLEGSDKRFVTTEQAEELRREIPSLLSLMTVADAVKATGFDPAGIAQDEDERKLLEEFRKKRAAEASKASEKKAAEKKASEAKPTELQPTEAPKK